MGTLTYKKVGYVTYSFFKVIIKSLFIALVFILKANSNARPENKESAKTGFMTGEQGTGTYYNGFRTDIEE